MIIAIDGPAGSGKSTVAKLVAGRLGFSYLDTGAMYRAVAWRALEENVSLAVPLGEDSIQAIREIAANERISFGYLPGDPLPSQVFIDDKDVSTQIRLPQTDIAVTPVSADPGVRKALTAQQQLIGASCDTVMEGRDIGTVVFPNAELKIFLTASAEERARRRYEQNLERAKDKGESYSGLDLAAVLADIIRRDEADSSRAWAPLLAAGDSITLDTTNMSIEDVVLSIVDLAYLRGAAKSKWSDKQ